MKNARLFQYLLIFIVGVLFGLIYLYLFQADNLGFISRRSLKSGSVWTGESDTQLSDAIPTPKPPLKILFAGDAMFDRHIRQMAQKDGYNSIIDQPLRELLLSHQLVVVNLEGPITDQPSVSLGSEAGSTNNFIFTFEPAVANFLAEHNIKLVNLGNNHITNFGKEGIVSTLNYLYQEKIEHFGWVASSPDLEEFNQEFLVLELNDYLLGFVNFNQFSNQSFDQTLETVKQMKNQVDFLIVYTHWGTEYAPEPNAVIKDQAHKLVEIGADLIIGSHPHVIQPYEDYLDARIYYSLGNFIFDQYFSDEVSRGLLVQLELKKEQVENNQEKEIIKPSYREFEVLMQSNEPVKLIFDYTPGRAPGNQSK